MLPSQGLSSSSRRFSQSSSGSKAVLTVLDCLIRCPCFFVFSVVFFVIRSILTYNGTGYCDIFQWIVSIVPILKIDFDPRYYLITPYNLVFFNAGSVIPLTIFIRCQITWLVYQLLLYNVICLISVMVFSLAKMVYDRTLDYTFFSFCFLSGSCYQ